MKTIIIPLVKNKSGDTSDIKNYRPIALVTVASKIFEIILLELTESYLDTTDNQLGFKKGHYADHCIYELIFFIQYYKQQYCKKVLFNTIEAATVLCIHAF